MDVLSSELSYNFLALAFGRSCLRPPDGNDSPTKIPEILDNKKAIKSYGCLQTKASMSLEKDIDWSWSEH